MKLHRDLNQFLVHRDETVRIALEKIEQNKHKVVYVVDEKSLLLGSFADGDFRRWVLQSESLNLNEPIIGLCNRQCKSMLFSSSMSEIEQLLHEVKTSIPLLDDKGHVVALAETGSDFMLLEGRRVSWEDRTFVIAEIGNNHQGDIEHAKRLVDVAFESGADSAKFQMRTMSSLYNIDVNSCSESQDLGSQYTLDLLERYQLTDDELFQLFDHCRSLGLVPLCTPWDIASLEKLERYGLTAYKIASADLTNFELLEAAAALGKPLICSTGMSSEDEIRQAVEFLSRHKAQFAMLHCNSTYPTPYKDVNLGYMNNLKEISRGIVGYSGHERGFAVCLAAVSMGAKIIEKHITTDRSLEGVDHSVSLLPDELRSMVSEIRNIEEALGSPAARKLSQGEMLNREVLAKSLYAARDIPKGEVIEDTDLVVRSPGIGVQPNRRSDLVGKPALRYLRKGEVFFESDIKGKEVKRPKYHFSRPVGIPVRYHDYARLTDNVDLDFVEFHLSYKDLDVKIENFIKEQQPIDVAVHAPELYSGGHLLDLASLDDEYRSHSVKELEQVIAHTRRLVDYFPLTENPVLVVNAGGWNAAGFDSKEVRNKKYQVLEESLKQIDLSGVTLALQTMPPFPWHFGGQSYHNLFVRPEECLRFCERTGVQMCLDISHSMMACNYYGWDLIEFVTELAPYVIHMHVVDAKGLDGEGVQIGRGDVDFIRLGKVMDELMPRVSFVPEIWQGHTDGGAGFWQALDFLERKFKRSEAL